MKEKKDKYIKINMTEVMLGEGKDVWIRPLKVPDNMKNTNIHLIEDDEDKNDTNK